MLGTPIVIDADAADLADPSHLAQNFTRYALASERTNVLEVVVDVVRDPQLMRLVGREESRFVDALTMLNLASGPIVEKPTADLVVTISREGTLTIDTAHGTYRRASESTPTHDLPCLTCTCVQLPPTSTVTNGPRRCPSR